MRPISLTIAGLRSFRAPVTLDFAGRDHIAIVGDTGAGKSSILEAMTYALYGRTSFAMRGGPELMNDTSTHMRVVFRFHVSGETWEVVRSMRRRDTGTLTPPSAQLSRVDETGTAIPEVEQVRRVGERVEELLGLDCEAFLRTVILPQGRFARLLVEDEPKARSAILRQVWRTDELEAAGEQAGEALREIERIRFRVKAEAGRHPEDPKAHLEQLREDHSEASRQAEAAGRDAAEADKAREAIRAAQEETSLATDVRDRLGALDLEEVTEELAPLAKQARGFDREEHELERQREQLEAERKRIPSGDGPTSEDVATALAILPDIESRVTAAEEAATGLRTMIETASEKLAEAEQLGQRAADAKKRSESHAAARSPLEETFQRTKRRLQAVEQAYERLTEREADLCTAEKQFEERRTAETASVEVLEEAKERRKRAQREAIETADHLAVVQRSNSAAHAARELHPGDSCPICRRELPTDWEAPAETGLGGAERIAEASRQAAEAAAEDVIRLDAELKIARSRLRDAEATVKTRKSQAREARQRIDRKAGLTADAPMPDRAAVLAPLKGAKENAEGAIADHDGVALKLREEAHDRDTEAQVGRQRAEAANQTVNASRRAANEKLASLKTALRAVPAPFRPKLLVPPEATELRNVTLRPVEQQLGLARARDDILKERQRELDRLSPLISETDASLRRLRSRRTTELETPLRSLAERLQNHRDVLVESVRKLGLDREITHAAGAEAEVLQAHARRLGTVAEEVAAAAGSLAQTAASKDGAARARFQTLAERLGTPADAGEPDKVFQTAHDRAEDARHQKRHSAEELERFQAIAGDVRRLLTILDEILKRERALRDLADALKPGRFLKWLTLRRSRELLVHASRKLEEVSGGRYAFVDPQETDDQWRVLDLDSNQPRTPASLSGGEQFLASLSLALGMVEMMARSGGRLEALFLDEGFGSLDTRNLDAAIQALGSAAGRGRMVAVISHVRAVAEQIGHVLAVTREVAGSRAVWLSAHERERLAASDAEATALAGLLD